ncbi:hypothetical protein VCV18_004069 [Metarhizium anisopliae]
MALKHPKHEEGLLSYIAYGRRQQIAAIRIGPKHTGIGQLENGAGDCSDKRRFGMRDAELIEMVEVCEPKNKGRKEYDAFDATTGHQE